MASDLAALLRAVERWQQAPKFNADREDYEPAIEVIDTTALRAAAHQHAEALRPDSSTCMCQACKVRRAAADFLDGKAE